jgi:hypothetical protein
MFAAIMLFSPHNNPLLREVSSLLPGFTVLEPFLFGRAFIRDFQIVVFSRTQWFSTLLNLEWYEYFLYCKEKQPFEDEVNQFGFEFLLAM